MRLVREWERRLAASPEGLEAARRESLQRMLRHAWRTTPFWRERFATAGLDPAAQVDAAALAALPPLDKTEVKRSRDAMLSSAIPDAERVEAATGGSTAAPMVFVRDVACLERRRAGEWVPFREMGRQPHHRWALIWGAAQDMGGAEEIVDSWRSRWLDRMIALPANRLDADGIDRFIEAMVDFRPRFVHGYAQSIRLVAERMLERGIRPSGVRGVTVTAEPIADAQRDEVARAFAAPVRRIYACREFGFVGWECERADAYHVNPLNAVIELVDGAGRPVEDGARGAMLVTDLLNRAMPLIRYRLGDLARRPTAPCGCGSALPRLELVAGREGDFIVTPSGRRISAIPLAQVRYEGVDRVQFVQRRRDRVEVRYVAPAELDASAAAELAGRFAAVIGDDVRVELRRVEAIPAAPSGKTVYVDSRLEDEVDAGATNM